MSNNDSFIDEVTEAVRRDRLFAAFRKYGWIGVLAVILIVGFSAWTEWRAHRQAVAAQRFGDAVEQAVTLETTEARTAALDAIPTATAEQAALLTFLRAAEPGAQAALDGLVQEAELSPVWRDIAEFKRLLTATDLPEPDRVARLEALTAPGAPLRLLALEQLALIDAAAGRTEAAIERLRAVAADTEATAGLRRRAGEMIVALGGTAAG